MVDETDEHYQLGVDDARNGRDPYSFQDPELQRRYNLGYMKVSAERKPIHRLEDLERIMQQQTIRGFPGKGYR